MAEDANARIRVDIDTAAALANIKNLQRQISTFHTSLAKSGAQATASSLQLQQSLINGLNRTGQFSAGIKNIKTTTDSFTNALQKNKLSMGEYFRYSAAATKSFGRFFSSEFDTINKVARERVKDLQTQYIKMGRDANGAMRAIAVRPLALDMDNLATKTQIAAQRQALLNQMLKQGSTNLLNFGKNTQWAGRQLMVGFTVPLVMLGSVAAKTFMDLEKQAVRFKRVYGEMFTTTEQTNKALAEIKELANEFTKYGVAVAKTMELAADIAATGKMGAELTAQVAETTRLAVLGGVEQSKALEATISLTDAFGVSAEDLAGKIDFLNAVENQTITSIEDLTIAIPKAGPVVQQLGGNVEDLTFFLTAMREGGINASEGANALKSGLAALINPTGKASEMLAEFGINIKGIVEANAGDVKGLVIDFANALDTLDPLNRARAIEQLFGKFQFSRLSTLFQNVVKEGNQASRVLKLTNATTEELAVLSERELKRVEDSPMFKFQKALEDIKVSLAPVGEAFLKAVTPLLEFGTSILKKFDELDEGAKGFVVGLTAIAGVIGPIFLMGFGLIANGVANVIKGFVFFKTALNKAGSASTQLGMQTDYMTQQQLEAAAVAASLDQVHSKLKQTFTSETAAINALTAAYERAILKQAAFAGTPMAVGRGAKSPKKLASGIVSVPGPKGAGDIIPAMLSPGEAVIPADQAEKYRGFIAAMISGKVPGFQSGVEEIKKAYARKLQGRGFTSAPEQVSAQTRKMQWNSMQEERKAKERALAKWEKDNGKKLRPEQRAYVLGPSDTAHTTSSGFKASILGKEVSVKSWHAKNLMAEDRGINRYAQKTSFDGGGTKDSQAIVKRLMQKEETAKLAKSLGIKESEVSKNLKNLSQGISPTNASGLKVLQAVAKQDKSYVGAAAAASAGARLAYEEKNPGKGFYATAGQRAYNPAVDKKVEAAQNKRVEDLNKAAKKEIAALNKSTKATEKSTKERTSSTKAVVENKKETAKNTKTTKEATKTSATPAQSRVTARETKQGTRYYVGNRLAADQQAAKTTYNRQQGAIRGAETRRANAAARAAIVPQQQPQAQSGGRGGIGLGTAGMIASGAVMAGSMMPGEIGKVSQNLMMPVMALSMILPMLTNKFAIITAAIAGLVAAFVLVQMAIAGIRKESAELTRSMSSGKESMAKFAELAGTVTPSEYMQKRRELEVSPFTVETGKTTFGQSFIGSESGTEMLASFEKQVETFGRSRAIESLQKQLVTAVATGVLSTEQAQSLAQSLGQKLNDYGITANINAAIQSIVGPDGEVLEGNTIKIYTEFIQSSTSGITGTGGILQSEDLTGGAPLWWWDTEKVAKREGEAAGIIANFYDENQQLIDAFDAENLKNIDALFEQGKYDEAIAAEEAYQIERKNLISSYNSQVIELQKDFAGVNFTKQQAILSQLTGLAKETDVKFGTAADKLAGSKALESTNILGFKRDREIDRGQALSAEETAKINEFQQVKVQFLGEIAAGNIDSETFNGLMQMFDPNTGKGQATLSVLANISTQVGPQALSQLENIFKVLDNPDLAAEIAVKIQKIDNPEELQNTLTTLNQLATFDGNGVEAKVVLEYFGANPDELEALQDKFSKLSKMGEEGKLDIQALVDQRIITTGDMEAFKQDQAYFESLDPNQQVRYTQVFLSKLQTIADSEIAAWRKANPVLSPKMSDEQVAQRISTSTANQYTRANPIRDTTAVSNEEETSGGGGGPSASPLDDLLKKLRDVRKNQVGVTKGFEASANAINKLFGDGKGINLFSGLQNDMRRLGAGEDLITLIAGMDPEEFARKKNSLFNFNKQTGEIIGFKNQLVNIGKALSSIALGEYVNEQQKNAKESKNQVLAFNQLRAAGYTVAEAYEAIQNAAVASAIAAGEYTQEQIADMLRLQRKAAEAAKEAARLTPEGMQEVFDDGFNKAMEAFDAQEKKLTIEYELEIADDQKLIDDAQSQIAGLQYRIDDYEADLRGIEDQENAINKTYDEKLEALEKVRKANQKVLDQEKGKLSVAEAITRGDLAAAARAAQDVRASSASGYFSDQTDALNAGRKAALGAVRSENGLSRIEIEEQIKTLADQIFEIEENTLEPATERVRLAGEQLQKRIDELEVLGNTKLEWEKIKNEIDVARTKSDKYNEAIKEALDKVTEVKNKWEGIDDQTVTLTIVEQRITEGDASGDNFGGDNNNNNNNGSDPLDPNIDTPQAQAHRIRQALNDASIAPKVSKALRDAAGVTPSTADRAEALINAYLSKITKAQADAIFAKAGVTGRSSAGGGGGPALTRKADGGPVSGPGTGRSDSIPALLSNGEYVIKASSVDKFGNGFLDSINAGVLPVFRDGGLVKRLGARLPNLFNSGKPSPMGPASRIPTAGSLAPPFMKPSFASKIPSTGTMTPSFIKPSFTKDFAQQSYKSPSGPRMNAVATLRPAIKPEANAATNNQSSVYNYNLSVNVASQSDPNVIAQTVMGQIRNVDSQRIRGNKFNGI